MSIKNFLLKSVWEDQIFGQIEHIIVQISFESNFVANECQQRTFIVKIVREDIFYQIWPHYWPNVHIQTAQISFESSFLGGGFPHTNLSYDSVCYC